MNIWDPEVKDLNRVRIIALEDFAGTLQRLKDIVDDLNTQYDPQSFINFDAGHNNISVEVLVKK
jgi:hypothetical protein